jgi:SSS family solute:Na+ symporter
MPARFTALDWTVVAAYVALLAIAGWLATRRQRDAEDYFLAGHRVPVWLVAVSVLSTTQSAATFLGAPDSSYRGDYTYLTTSIGALLGALLTGRVLVPRLYALRATTCYELLAARFDRKAMRAAGGMYLVGRVFASGARLYLAAIAVAMIMFSNVEPGSILAASVVLVVLGLAFTSLGGLNAILWSDLLQVILYTGAALIVLWLLWTSIPASPSAILHGLAHTPGDGNKLAFIDLSLDLSHPFSLLATLTGIVLLCFASTGLDQDTTQRLLACRDSGQGERALYLSAVAAVPVVLLFMAIGSLLYVFYDRPDLMGRSAAAAGAFRGEKITIFMQYILTQIPPGIRGLVAVGVLAAAALNSELISMSSVLVEDFYRPWAERRPRPQSHYVTAGRVGQLVMALALLAMATLCYWWQRYTAAPLLAFALGVMSFAYSGLLGVYLTALFTRRGSSLSARWALATGFGAILVQQAFVVDLLHLPESWKALAFPFQLCLGTAVAFATCAVVPSPAREHPDGEPA